MVPSKLKKDGLFDLSDAQVCLFVSEASTKRYSAKYIFSNSSSNIPVKKVIFNEATKIT